MDALDAAEVRLPLTVAILSALVCWETAALGRNTVAFVLGIIAVMNGALTALNIERHSAEAHARTQDDRSADGDH